MRLAQVRECNGSCCVESPQFPNSNGVGCKYQEGSVCILQRDNLLPTESVCPTNPHMTGEEAFTQHCLGWPHNSPVGRGTGNCCWQWVDD